MSTGQKPGAEEVINALKELGFMVSKSGDDRIVLSDGAILVTIYMEWFKDGQLVSEGKLHSLLEPIFLVQDNTLLSQKAEAGPALEKVLSWFRDPQTIVDSESPAVIVNAQKSVKTTVYEDVLELVIERSKKAEKNRLGEFLPDRLPAAS